MTEPNPKDQDIVDMDELAEQETDVVVHPTKEEEKDKEQDEKKDESKDSER